jgi:hypothetical protein
MKLFLTRFFGSKNRLSKLDSLILNTVKDHLGDRLVQLWEKQMVAINKIQRLPCGAEVNFYRMENGRPTFDTAIQFPNKKDELLVSTVQITAKETSSKLIAQLWSVKGFIFSIEYSGMAESFDETLYMDPPLKFIVECEIKADLSEENP